MSLLFGFGQEPVAEVQSFEEEAPGNLPSYVSAEDAPFLSSMSPNQRALAAVRGDLWTSGERRRFESFQETHARRFPDVPVPLREEDLTEAQQQELEQLNRGINHHTSPASVLMPTKNPEISALLASPFYRHSTAFRKETKEQQRLEMEARQKVDDMSKRGRWGRSGRGSDEMPPWYVILPIAVALAALKFWPRRKR